MYVYSVPFILMGVSTDVALLCSKATMFRETIKGTLNCVYQWKMMNNFVHVKNMSCGQEFVSIDKEGKT
jgi:hypothetical protein